MRGFESESADQAFDDANYSALKLKDRLEASAKGDADFLKVIQDIENLFAGMYSVYDPTKWDEQILAGANKTVPDKYKDLTIEWIKSKLFEMKTLQARDRAIANSLTSSKESGVMLIGLFHLESLMHLLQKSCLDSTKATVTPNAPASTVR